MSYLELLREAEARLHSTPPAHEKDELTKKAPDSPARHVAEALPFLRMPLDEFARRGASLEVRVTWLDVTLWMVPTDRDAVRLMAEGILRGRIWTGAELIEFMTIAERTPETVK